MTRNSGATLVEAMAAVLIISVAIIGLLQTFSYGNFNVERMGIKRRALEILNSRMEQVQQKRKNIPEGQIIPHTQDQNESEKVILDRVRDIKADVRTDISFKEMENSLSYQLVTVTLNYNDGPYKDSLTLRTKMYLR